MTEITQSFTTRYLPWTKIGTVIDDESVDSATAARLGGIDFDVELQPAGRWKAHEEIADGDGSVVYIDADGNHVDEPGRWITEPSRRAVARVDTDEWYSYVSTDYQLVQFREAFAFMDGIKPRYVAAGALSGGRQGFMVVQLPEEDVDVELHGEVDPHDMYVVLRTSHDLSKSIEVAVLMLRNRCMNMLTLPSFRPHTPQRWSIRHVGDPHAKLRQAQDTLTKAGNYRDAFQSVTTQLASVRVTADDLRGMARVVLPERLKTRDDMADKVVERFQHDDTVGYVETGWGAVNAMSTYLQWGRDTAVRTTQSEFTSPLDGDTAKYVNRLAHLVMQRA